jgi:hypothetical protein
MARLFSLFFFLLACFVAVQKKPIQQKPEQHPILLLRLAILEEFRQAEIVGSLRISEKP